MFTPEFIISNKVLQNIVAIEKALSRFEATEIPAQQSLKFKAHAKTLNLFHLAHMLQNEISLKDAEKINEGRWYDQSSQINIILNNLRNLLEFSRNSLQDEYIDIDISILLHMNKLFLTNWKEAWDVKFRNPELVEDTVWNDWARLCDRTIEPLKLQDELRAAFDWYKISAPKLHPLIRISIWLYRLIQLAPFSQGNKFTIIAGTDFLLKKNGYLAADFLPVFRLFDLHNRTFLSTLEKISVEQATDLTPWIETFTNSLYEELLKIENDLKDQFTNTSPQKKTFLDLNKRQLKILKYLQTIPTVKREDYVQMMSVSSMTAFRDLNDLVDKKLLKVTGKARATKYMLTNR